MIAKAVVLAVDPTAAFALFTDRITDWWPPEHRPSGDRESRVALSADGRFWERTTDGRETELGRVLEWDPPNRLILDFYLGTDASRPTRVAIRFVPVGDGTRVVVEHNPTPLSEEVWHTRAPRFEESWTTVLAALKSSSEQPPA